MKQRIYVKRPIEIAITGKIGTGKTTTCKLLKNLGYQIFESDNEVKKPVSYTHLRAHET